MHCAKSMGNDLFYVGGSDRRLSLFENVYPIPNGISYNSYIVMDEKTILLDTVDSSIRDLFIANVNHVLNGRTLDYLVVNHMEPDHCRTIIDIITLYPEVKIIGNTKTFNIMKQLYDFDVDKHAIIIKEGDEISTGKHVFTFYMAPMVHWPETMITYDLTTKVLFSGDAFGTFNALMGNLYADEMNFECEWLPEARRYYSNIVGKYGISVQGLLKKAAALEISMICPLHGPVWRENIEWFIEKYNTWSLYEAEEKNILILYGSIYGNTENAANILASSLSDKGIKNIKMYDVSLIHPSYIVSEAFRCSHIVFASSTYNGNIFTPMEIVLHDLRDHNFQKRKVSVIENGSWALSSGKKTVEILSQLKNIEFIGETISIKSSVKEDIYTSLLALSDLIFESMN